VSRAKLAGWLLLYVATPVGAFLVGVWLNGFWVTVTSSILVWGCLLGARRRRRLGGAR
jgi:hypothetical protein